MSSLNVVDVDDEDYHLRTFEPQNLTEGGRRLLGALDEVVVAIENKQKNDDDDDYSFYLISFIETNKQTISVGIEGGSRCCEEYSCGISILPPHQDTPLSSLVGEPLLEVKWGRDRDYKYRRSFELDACRNENSLTILAKIGPYKVALWCYNYHNGYYSHKAFVRWHEYSFEDEL